MASVEMALSKAFNNASNNSSVPKQHQEPFHTHTTGEMAEPCEMAARLLALVVRAGYLEAGQLRSARDLARFLLPQPCSDPSVLHTITSSSLCD
mgnify:CR=1 FL=1